jgi:tetratricopeptide (TPR) repeat protein
MLTFYYLAALSIGYFGGYILLVFGQRPAKVREHTPGALRGVNLLVFALPWLALIALPVGLLFGLPYKLRDSNWTRIQAERAPALEQFSIATAKALPANTAVVLGDQISRIQLALAGWQKLNGSSGPVFIETSSLGVGDYVRYLIDRYPQLRQSLGQMTIPKYLAVLGEIQVLQKLPQPVYYLEPSFGAFFERFYLKPAGLVFQLVALTPHSLLAPQLTDAEVAANINYWKALTASPVFDRLVALSKYNNDASAVSAQSSRAADYLGVVLQREQHLNEAHAAFNAALALNPKNAIAKVNDEFNGHLRAGNTKSVDLGDEFNDEVKRYGWQGLLTVDGPPDEPELNFLFGQLIAANDYLRQASEYFLRRIALRPGDPDAEIAMAKTYVDMDQPGDALAMLQPARSHAKPANADEITRVEALAYMAKHDEARAEDLLKSAATKEDNNTGTRLAMLADFYRAMGYSALRANRTTEAKTQFNTALATLDQQLRWLAAPDRARTSGSQTSEVLMRKAEVQSQLGDHNAAIASLNKALDLQPDNPRGLMNRAIAELQAGKYDDAKRDYKQLDNILPTPNFAVYYGLGEIASKTNDRSGAIKNFKKYLKYAPENSDEAKQVRERLQKLEKGA